MITVIIKVPHEAAVVKEVQSSADFETILGGDFEIVHDDQLAGIHLVVHEDARGVEANNFPITSEGFLDWVYGTCIFVKQDSTSFSLEEVQQIEHFLSQKK